MGSTGSGSFSDYSKRKSTSPEANNGGSSGNDKCGTAISTSLEEISRCFYYINYGHVPPTGTEISIAFNGLRIVAETKIGEEIGYFPTRFNYLKLCIDDGYTYSGRISSSKDSPTPSVFVDIIPI